MGKERSIQIVDSIGNVVLTLDGDVPGGIRSAANAILHDERDLTWPLLAGSLASYIWTCRVGVWSVVGIKAACTVSGGASATIDVLVCSGVTAIASGVTQLTAVLDVQETAPFKALGTLITTPTLIYPGDNLAMAIGGTLTGLVGVLTVSIKRVG